MEALVTIAQGQLLGTNLTTLSGIQYQSFLGIPYAQPPLGDLRFKDPLPPQPWTGQKTTQKEGNKCSQIDTLSPNAGYIGDEDCLYLNVYTPTILMNLLPVMFFIHGGGFSLGSGSPSEYGPEHFMEEDVVLVTFNYRLGILGFLNLGTPEISGNAGLKDMTMALTWVKNNIEKFGGNPENVTIFGESAGGAAVQFLALSNSSNTLFQKAISQSGSCLSQWAHTRKQVNPVEKAREVASTISKTEFNNTKEVLDFLQIVPVEDLVSAVFKSRSEEELLRQASFPFAPVFENTSFFSHPLEELLEQPQYLKIPYLSGYNDKEGMVYNFAFLANPNLFKTYDSNFEYIIPYDIGLQFGSKESKEMAAELKKFYFGDKKFTIETIDNYFDLMTDMAFLYKIWISVKMNADNRTQYFYRFAFDGDLNYFKKYAKISFNGTCHSDDLGYLFTAKYPVLETPKGSDSDIMRRRMVKMWTNFAKFGDPVPKTDDLLTTKWEKVDSAGDLKYLRIEKDLKMDMNPENERMLFWDGLYKKYKVVK